MKVARSVNNFEYMYDTLADASACALAISEIKDDFILITCEEASWNDSLEDLKTKCKALFYIGKPDAEIMFATRSFVTLLMQADNLQEAVMLASQFKVNGVNKIIFLPCIENINGVSAEQMTEDFKNIVITI